MKYLDYNGLNTLVSLLKGMIDAVSGALIKLSETHASKEAYGLVKIGKTIDVNDGIIEVGTHDADKVTQDATHRFVSDTEKTKWNAKAETTTATSATNGLMSSGDKAKLDKLSLGDDGKIDASNLPSYVDDVIEGYLNGGNFYTKRGGSNPNYTYANDDKYTPETGKIYVNLDDNKTYRWSGTQYTVISETLSIGNTAGTAYGGDAGKKLADALAGMGKTLTIKAVPSKGNAEVTTYNNKEDITLTMTAITEGEIAKIIKEAFTSE